MRRVTRLDAWFAAIDRQRARRSSIPCIVLVLGTVCAAGTGLSRTSTSGISAHVFYGDGPPLSYTGGFGELNCRACHWESPLNVGGVLVEIGGLPSTYVPGTKYVLTVTLRQTEMKIAGFQLAARFDSGTVRARQAGDFQSLDPRTRVTRNDTTGVSYVGHTRVGTRLTTPGEASWSFEWTAPATASGPISFHVAANAADDTNSEGGDFIYARTAAVLGVASAFSNPHMPH